LGKRAETNRKILAVTRCNVLPGALQLGHAEQDEPPCEENEEDESGVKKKRQLKGKQKSKHLMNTML